MEGDLIQFELMVNADSCINTELVDLYGEHKTACWFKCKSVLCRYMIRTANLFMEAYFNIDGFAGSKMCCDVLLNIDITSL